ncbi:hypothetical protein E8D34_09680 [Nocardioides sp. GY 10113]|uniref:DUF6174 domain-containing protein n=1 Tax=Nocardioides sp. GY 10113 TaxID=2569761 RepID=UPI0010A8ACDF|nr:DUF6174 domain-containing protein [Nocardioides sp. GY 10113]TIC87392.1 hypothetical protein E8D34_09680 [Nocardioides sp. GY 10113]
MRTRNHRTNDRRLAPIASVGLVLGLALAVAGCAGNDDPDEATPASTAPLTTSGLEDERTFEPATYRYRLELRCHCPTTGKVEVRVRDGEARSAKLATGPDRGKAAPEAYLLTIAEILSDAALPGEEGEAEVVWPASSEWPTKVYVDRNKRAVDDEVTYLISDVDIAG